MIRVSDYIASTLVNHGISKIFIVTGGGSMHLNDAFGRCPGLEFICCHHEQACTMAAESYFRISNQLAAVNVTTGPGGTNTITGVYGAFVDSMGMVVVSGQVKWETMVQSTGLPLRQLGDQEVNIISLVKPITKYAITVTDPSTIRYHLERAIYLAKSGRPGPTWIDVPINVQGAKIDPALLAPYDPKEDAIPFDIDAIESGIVEIFERLKMAKRPVIYAGSGIRLSGTYDDFLLLINKLGVPVVTAWNSNDLLPDDSLVYAGRPGSIGTRAGNFTVQNADLLIILGCRLNIRLVSYNWESFARNAFKIAVDIDKAELQKPTLKIDLPLHADLRTVIPKMLVQAESWVASHGEWLAWCKVRVAKYPVVQKEYWEKSSKVNPYCFMDALFSKLSEGEIIACGDGTACVTAFQAAKILRGQRLFHNSGCASMGYDLPAAVGAAISSPEKSRVICLAGDGSIMMNLQELQTIVGQELPIKIFILNNSGYHSIRQTQAAYFPDNIIGCGIDSGLSFPDFEKLAFGFQIPFRRCSSHEELTDVINWALSIHGASICEIVLDLEQPFAPKLSSRRLEDGRMITAALEDMAPFLSREEMASNMIAPYSTQ